MTLELYLVFVVATLLLVATPGPNVALIVGTTLRYGQRTGLLTVGGVTFGILLQMSAVALGLTWIVDLFSRHFDLIRYAGAAYLAFIGLQQLLSKRQPDDGPAVPLGGQRAFGRGLAVAFANPKTLIFHAAFLPQFITPTSGPEVIWILVATYFTLAGLGDAVWSLGAARARAAVSGRAQYIADKASGAILLGGAAVLLVAVRR